MENYSDSTDEIIRRAIGDGANLPNAGKRLDLDDPYTPDDMYLANKILKEAGYMPSWMADSKELDALREEILRASEKAIRANSITERLNAEIKAFNKRVLTFNLKAPQGISHKRMIDLERERRRITGG